MNEHISNHRCRLRPLPAASVVALRRYFPGVSSGRCPRRQSLRLAGTSPWCLGRCLVVRRRYLIVVPRPLLAAPRRYLIGVPRPLPAVVLFLRRRNMIVVPRPIPAALHCYLIVVPRPLPAAPLVVRRRYLIVAPMSLPAAPLVVRRRYLGVVPRPFRYPQRHGAAAVGEDQQLGRCTAEQCVYEHGEQAWAPHTNGPRHMPRCGALYLLKSRYTT
jgi:hypothetical protein